MMPAMPQLGAVAGCPQPADRRKPFGTLYRPMVPSRLRSRLAMSARLIGIMPNDLRRALTSIAPTSSGERPVSLPLPDPDAPTVPAAGVSAPKAAQSRQRARGHQPETPAP